MPLRVCGRSASFRGLDLSVPFVANPDRTHCFQAALRMVLGYLLPEQELSWQRLDEATHKVDGLWTWPTSGALWLAEQGLDVQCIEVFDYETFAREGESYLTAFYGDEIGREAAARTLVDAEMILAKRFVEAASIDRRVPDAEDIEALLARGYVVICNVNGRALRGEPGFAGHFVVVKGCDETSFRVHDPGPPPREDLAVPRDVFDRAWSYAGERARNILAIGKR